MLNIIPYGRQHISEEDIQAVIETLNSDFLTQGPKVAEFEKKFASYVGAEFAVALSNGTAALHLSALALGVKPGDKVLTTPITFAASANCIAYCGAEVEFVDIDPDSYLIDLKKVEARLKSVPIGTYQGIIPVDFAGRAIPMEALRKLADTYELWILEDSCHAPGGYFIDSFGENQFCGNGKFSDLAIFSFHPVKHIATGEGGMVTTNDAGLYEKLLELRTHGITRSSSKFSNSLEFAIGEHPGARSAYPGWYMEMQHLGYNYRLTDFQSALGISQLMRAEEGLKRRRTLAKRYFEAFDRSPFIISQSGYIEGHAYHLYILEVQDRIGLYDYLRENGVFAQVHYIPTHLMPFYRQKGWKEGDMPIAESYYKHCISLPMYPSMADSQQERVIELIYTYYS